MSSIEPVNLDDSNTVFSSLSGTYSIFGTDDTALVTGNSNITITAYKLPIVFSGDTIRLTSTTSTVTDTEGFGDTITGHGTEAVYLGTDATLDLSGGMDNAVEVGTFDTVNLTATGSNNVYVMGNGNMIYLGGTHAGIVCTQFLNGSSNNMVYLRDPTTYLISDAGTNNNFHLGSASSISVSGAAGDTFDAMDWGSHVIDLPTGDDNIYTRDGTIPPESLTITGFVNGQDVVHLNIGQGTAQNAADVLTHITNGSGGAVLTLGSETITFVGLTASQFHAADFTIAL